MKRVLLTGASGFIGRQTWEPLVSKGYEVHAADLYPEAERREEIHWHQVDLLDAKQIKKLVAAVCPTHLLHFAWYVSPGKYIAAPENLRWVQASLELLQTFRVYGGKRVVMAGTCLEYDWHYGYCSEEFTPLAPVTLYGICKHSLQMMFAAFAAQAGLSTAWGRIFFLYGPYEHPERLVAYVIRSLLNGQPAHCSHGFQIRDFLHVADVADAFVELLDSDILGPVNIGSGCPISVREIVGKIAAQLDREDLIHFGADISQSNEPSLLVANIGRLSADLGWSPKSDIDRGLAQTIDWWKTHLYQPNI